MDTGMGVADDRVGHVAARECIRVVDVMGGDARVVNAARVSLDRWVNEDEGTNRGDERLIRYLAEHQHVSPFFHPQICLHIKMPIFVAREWYRHVVGVSRNEVSRRYVDGPVECFLPESVRERHPGKKQGSKATAVEQGDECAALMKGSMEASVATYRRLLEKGTAPEVARMVLPQSMMTQFIETASLAAYARIYLLRAAPDAQIEIQAYAKALGDLLGKHFPVSWPVLTGQEREEAHHAAPHPSAHGSNK